MSSNKEKDDFLKDLYYNKNYLLGRDKLFFHISKTLGRKDISRRYIAGWLMKQEVNQLYSQKKKPTSIRPIITSRPGSMLQIDLIDYSKKPSTEGFKYILNVIDVFSKKIWLQGIYEKSIKSVIPELNYIVKEIQKDYVIQVIQSDNGGEFNIKFPNIKHIQSAPYTPQAQAYVERSNGTVKKILNKLLFNISQKNGEDADDVLWDDDMLLKIEDIYNETLQRSIGMSPDEAYKLTEEQQAELYSKQKNGKAKSYKEIDTLLSLGDTVRLLIPLGKTKTKGQPTYSRELYKIIKVIPGNPKTFTIPRYKISRDGNNLPGNYPLSKLLHIPGGIVEKE